MKSLKEFLQEERVDEATFRVEQLQNLAKKVAKETDKNNHNEARLIIAKAIKFKRGIVNFDSIMKIHDFERSMHRSLIEYRDYITNEMLKYIKSKYGDDIYELFYQSL